MERPFDVELERRLGLLEEPDSDQSLLADLPRLDVWVATVALVVLGVLLIWWGYPA